MDDYTYSGSELGIFALATTWKHYFKSHMEPYVRGNVLEVGAGIGANSRLFDGGAVRSWTCLEPDRRFADELAAATSGCSRTQILIGALADISREIAFDTILYLDVIEHLGDDRAELKLAASHLNAAGALILLAPAHPWLFTPFDAAIGHFRRYTRKSLAEAVPPGLVREKLLYLDSAGMLASLGNRLFLKSAAPTHKQIQFWDKRLVPCSRRLDRLLGYTVGKSVLGVWRKNSGKSGA